MSEWIDIPLARGEGQDGSPYASDAELMNLVLTPTPPGSRAPFSVNNAPAIKLNASVAGQIRGGCVHESQIWAVIGTTVYFGDTTLSAVPVGSMPGTAKVRMVSAGTHVVMVDGTNARAATELQVFSCSRGDFCDVTYQDGYTIYAETDSDSVYVSSLDDPTTINALHFTTADALPGIVTGVFSLNRELVVFKTKSTEFYFNSGSSGFPFRRASPGLMEIGLYNSGLSSATHSPHAAQYANQLYFVGHDKKVYSLSGYRPQKISTPWLESAIASAAEFWGSTYSVSGRAYYMLSVQSGDHYLYDIETGLWSTGRSPIASTYRYLALNPIEDWVLVLAQQDTTGWAAEIKTTSSTYLQDGKVAGSPAPANPSRVMTLPQVAAGGKRLIMSELYLDMEKATTSGTINLQWSDDGGANYTTARAGTATNERVRWQRLGSFRQRILRFTFEINNRVAILGCRARVEVGE